MPASACLAPIPELGTEQLPLAARVVTSVPVGPGPSLMVIVLPVELRAGLRQPDREAAKDEPVRIGIFQVANNVYGSRIRKKLVIAGLDQLNAMQIPTIDELEQKLQSAFDRWLSDLDATVIPVSSEIDWSALIDKAVGRKPPFSPRTEKGEKGFKDAIILEMLLDFHKMSSDRTVVFVCADGLLSKTAGEHLGHESRSLNEFHSLVDLQVTQRHEEFIRALLTKVAEVFYTENDPNCIWLKYSVLDQIHEALGVKWSGVSGEVFEPASPSSYLIPSIPIYQSLKPISNPLLPVTEESVFIGQSSFIKKDDERFFYWQTEVELQQIFKPKEVPSASFSSLLFHDPFFGERLRKLVVGVKWKSKISFSPEFDFTKEAVEAIESLDEQFETPDADARIRLRHPALSQLKGVEGNINES